jgi:hypothetical protein
MLNWKQIPFVEDKDALMKSFTEHSLKLGQEVLVKRSMEERKHYGQFLTPEPLAQFMTQQLGTIGTYSHENIRCCGSPQSSI